MLPFANHDIAYTQCAVLAMHHSPLCTNHRHRASLLEYSFEPAASSPYKGRMLRLWLRMRARSCIWCRVITRCGHGCTRTSKSSLYFVDSDYELPSEYDRCISLSLNHRCCHTSTTHAYGLMQHAMQRTMRVDDVAELMQAEKRREEKISEEERREGNDREGKRQRDKIRYEGTGKEYDDDEEDDV